MFVVLAYGAFHISPRMRSDIEICQAGPNSEIFPDLRFHYVRWHNHLIMTFAENDITPQNGEFAPTDQASAATPSSLKPGRRLSLKYVKQALKNSSSLKVFSTCMGSS